MDKFEECKMLYELMNSRLPKKWSLINIMGYTDEEAEQFLVAREESLKKEALLTYECAMLEQNGE